MSDLKFGEIISGTAERDAIHIAVAPVVAKEKLFAGQHIGFVGAAEDESTVGLSGPLIGIVDPFLKGPVYEGQRCWMFLYPNTITALRHEWTHPAFCDKPNHKAAASEVWLRSEAARIGVDYEELLERARDYIETGEYWSEGGRFEGEYLNDDFWPHYEAVTGTKVPEKSRGSFLSCSC
jgi:hypothetical protein